MPDNDSVFMLRALELAAMAKGMTNPNPMVGAVIVKDGRIIGEGFHRKAGTAHAEVNAIANAAERNEDTEGATIYVTLEPCSTFGRTSPCTEAIKKAKIKKTVIGCLDPNPRHNGQAIKILQDAGIEVVHGIAEAACRDLNRAFFCWITTGKPFVMLKMAMTLDGKTATRQGHSFWVSGEQSRQRVQELRQCSDAIMVGGETLRLDHPKLTVRTPENWPRQPLRLVASRTLTDQDLKNFFPDGNAMAVNPEKETWDAMLLRLGRMGITTLLIEGGSGLAGSAFQANAIDYVEFHIAPKLLGGAESRPVLGGVFSPLAMTDSRMLKDVKVCRYGEDIAVSGYLK